MITKFCTNCGKELPLTKEYFYVSGKAFKRQCKECYKAKRLEYYYNHQEEYHEYYEQNKEHIIQYQTKYSSNNRDRINEIGRRKQHKRRALKNNSGGSYTRKEFEECLIFFDNKCCYSGIDLDSNNLSADHVIPINKNGTNYIYNIVCCDRKINSSKSNKDVEEWYRKQNFFSEERLHKIYEWVELNK